jgi:hypothetical protein
VDEAAFRAAMRALPPWVVRAKGILALSGRDGRAVFQHVGKRGTLALEPGPAPGASSVVAIGRAGPFDPAALDALFAACR